MKNKINIIILIWLSSISVWANPITGESLHGDPVFLTPAIPLLIESLIIALGMKLKQLKFTSTLAFWFLITNLTYLPAQWFFDHASENTSMVMLLVLESVIVIIETTALILWTKKKINQTPIVYPFILVLISNIISFVLGSCLIIGWK